MPTSVRSSPGSSSSGLTAALGTPAPQLTVFIICVLLLLYGYEIFNFSLSIDEEIHSHANALRASISQGRWALGLLYRVFPPLGNTPVLSTVLFCAGLGVSASVLGRVLFRSHAAQWGFAGIFVSSPLWPHIAEFNPASWGVGIGSVLLTLSLLLFLAKPRFGDIWAASLLAFATGIYQTFFAWFLVLLCIRHLSVLLGTAPLGATEEHQRFPVPWLRVARIAVGGLLGYLAVEILLLKTFSVSLSYVQGYLRPTDFVTNPRLTVSILFYRCWDLFLGTGPIYLGYGRVLTMLPLVGLVIVAVRLFGRGSPASTHRLLAVGILVAAFLLAISPMVIAAGAMPTRGLICSIPMSAFLAGVALSHKGRLKKPLYGALAATLLISIWVTVSLFYADHVARQRDEILTARIMARVDQILPNPSPGRTTPFVVIGSRPSSNVEGIPRVEVFGASFFEHGGGNPARVVAYLRILGIDTLAPLSNADVAPPRSVIEAMPVWPAAGSVAMVGGVLVIKLRPLPPA